MIFVTVGTHEQQFDRLIKWIDEMIEDGIINEEVIIQKGYTEYEPKHCKSYKLIGYEEMQKYILDARIVITHGGPASFIAPLTIGKIPIVVPRRKEYNEHVNNHQLEFTKEVEKRMKNIIVVENKEEMVDVIKNYKNKIKDFNVNSCLNNLKFNKMFLEEIRSMY